LWPDGKLISRGDAAEPFGDGTVPVVDATATVDQWSPSLVEERRWAVPPTVRDRACCAGARRTSRCDRWLEQGGPSPVTVRGREVHSYRRVLSMPAAADAGLFRKYKGHRVLVLKTDPSAGAVRIARISSAKPGAGTPSVQVKTWWSDFWVLLGKSDVIGAADLETTWTGPEKLAKKQLDVVLEEFGKRDL
jgi:hypothetical protein